MFFKRNQVEEAISRTIDESSTRPSCGLRTQIKRLLDLDRSLKRLPRSREPELANYAFYDRDQPGRGIEVMFSDANAFALLMGIRMLNHGWPQRFAVLSLRQAHDELSARHKAIVSTPSKKREFYPGAPGQMAFAYPNSAFLLIVSDDKTDRADRSSYVHFFEDQNSAFEFQMHALGCSCSWFGLESSARTLQDHLLNSLPKSRGRGA